MQRKQSNKKEITYQYLDINRVNSYIQNQNYPSLLDYAANFQWDINNVKNTKYFQWDINNVNNTQYEDELRICENLILDHFLSLQDEQLVRKLLIDLIDKVDLFPEIYEKACARLIDNKTPEQAMMVYRRIKDQCFCFPSHTILEFISTNTKKADTCLFFINDLEQSYQKYGNKSYDKFILEFYQRFRAVCTKEEYEKFIESGMQPENNPQKQ